MFRALSFLVIASIATTAQANVLITEIMYDNFGSNEHEYVELYNSGAATVDLTGWTLSDDPSQTIPHPVTLTGGSIAPGGTAVLIRTDSTARTLQNYIDAWGASVNWIEVAAWPVYTNGGDVVHLTDPGNNVVASVDYSITNGYPAPNDAASIYMLDPTAVDPYAASNWALSQDGVDGAHFGNSPRASDIGSPGFVIPEPASMAMITLGLFGLLRRP